MFTKLCAIFLGITILFSWSVAEAATLYLDPSQDELYIGDTLMVAVRVDVDAEECINVVDATISYPEGLELVDTSIGSSILRFWPEEPSNNPTTQEVSFVGGIPNGYCGRIKEDPFYTNTLVELVFQLPGTRIGVASSSQRATLAFADSSTVYLNDGRGTAVVPDTLPTAITLHNTQGEVVQDLWNQIVNADVDPPEDFSITLTRDEDNKIQNGRYYIVFNTTDKQSGLDHYEVIEEPFDQLDLFSWGRVDAPWITTRSPYVLKDQTLNSIIRVKAVDKAGNEYVATYIPDESLRSLSEQQKVRIALYITIAVILVSVLGVWVYRVGRIRRQRKKQVDTSNDEHTPDQTNTNINQYDYDDL